MLFRFEHGMNVLLTLVRYVFILLMIIYTGIATVSFAIKLSLISFAEGALPFATLNELFTDGLFVLIVLAIVKALFLHNSFDYVVTLLETGFVVMIRKLIVLSSHPVDDTLILILGGTSALFFILIIVTHFYRRKWHIEDQIRKEQTQNHDPNTKHWYEKT